jgi:enamine deaminase RidA (YjgF/YER057c/UK114 family)
MATAPYSRKLSLTRDQLAAFLTDQQQIRQFELLFSVVDELQVITGTDFEYQADSAAANANNALAQIIALAQDTAVDNAVVNAKAQQALDALALLVRELQALAITPAIQHNNSVVTDYIDFDEASPHADKVRRMAWNDFDETLDLGMRYGVTQQIGLETYARVQNNTGVLIPNGTVVGFTGVVPDSTLAVAPYLANGATPTLYVLGVMTHDFPDSGTRGYCTTFGYVRDLDTSAYLVGDVLYASPTVAGGLTKIKPTAPNNVVPIAAVLKVSATVGVIFVRPTIQQQLYYGEFTKTNSQSPAVTNTAYPLLFNTTQVANGVYVGATTSQVFVTQAGLYNLATSVQITSGNSSQKSVWVWLRKNGTTDLPNSARVASITLNNGYLVVTLNVIASLLANEFIEVMYAANNTNVSISTVAATAFAPAAPAVILAVTQTEQ